MHCNSLSLLSSCFITCFESCEVKLYIISSKSPILQIRVLRGKEDIKEPSPLKTRRQRKKEKEVVEGTTEDSKDSVIVILFRSIKLHGLALQTVFVQFLVGHISKIF